MSFESGEVSAGSKIDALAITADLMLKDGDGLRSLFALARRYGMMLKQHREGELVSQRGSLFWFGQTAERECTVQVARYSSGWSVEITCGAGQVRLSDATPESVLLGLAALLGPRWSWQLYPLKLTESTIVSHYNSNKLKEKQDNEDSRSKR